jgi:hypothetical protein
MGNEPIFEDQDFPGDFGIAAFVRVHQSRRPQPVKKEHQPHEGQGQEIGPFRSKGFAGFGGRSLAAAWKVFRRGRYWVSYLAVFALGIYVPVQLVHWVPEVESLGAQVASLAARFLAAYLMMVTAWLVLASLLGRLRRAR